MRRIYNSYGDEMIFLPAALYVALATQPLNSVPFEIIFDDKSPRLVGIYVPATSCTIPSRDPTSSCVKTSIDLTKPLPEGVAYMFSNAGAPSSWPATTATTCEITSAGTCVVTAPSPAAPAAPEAERQDR